MVVVWYYAHSMPHVCENIKSMGDTETITKQTQLSVRQAIAIDEGKASSKYEWFIKLRLRLLIHK